MSFTNFLLGIYEELKECIGNVIANIELLTHNDAEGVFVLVEYTSATYVRSYIPRNQFHCGPPSTS